MTFGEIIKTILEFFAVVLLIIGFINEKKVIAFEQKIWKKFKAWINS